MQQVKVRLIKKEDYSHVRKINELTQLQYLGKKWEQLNTREKEKILVSKKKDFKAYVELGYSLVALIENNIVGFLFAYENSPFKNSVYVKHVAISPEFQGYGIGAVLYKKLIAVVKSKKIKKIEALINTDNPQSINLHQKIGFTLNDRKEAILLLPE